MRAFFDDIRPLDNSAESIALFVATMAGLCAIAAMLLGPAVVLVLLLVR